MEFCPSCENLLYPAVKKDLSYFICKACGYKQNNSVKESILEEYRIVESINHHEELDVIDEDANKKELIECPKCNNNVAFYSEKYNEDAEIIILYRCTKCKYAFTD